MTSNLSDMPSGDSRSAEPDASGAIRDLPAAEHTEPAREPVSTTRMGAAGWWLLILGALLRFTTINTRGFWLDEAITVEQTRLPSVLDVISYQVGNVHPPLFHVLMHLWAQVFGYGEVAMRSFAALLGIACIPVAYHAGRIMYSRRVGLIAAGIVAFSPYFIWYSQEARMYSLMMFLAFASMALLAKAMRDDRARDWVAYSVVTTLGLYTHFFFLFLVFGQVIGVLAVAIRDHHVARAEGAARWSLRRPLGILSDAPVLKGALVSGLAMALIFSLWVFRSVFFEANALVSSATGSGLGYGQTPPELAWRINDAVKMLIEMLLGFHPNPLMFALVAMWPLFISLLLLMLDVIRPLSRSALMPLFSVVGLLVIAALGQWQGQVLASRYAIAAAAPVVLVLAAIIDLMPHRAAKTLMVCGILALCVMWVDQSFNPDNSMRHDNRIAIGTIVDRYRPGDMVIYEPFYSSPVFDYYLPQRIPSHPFPQHGKFGFVRRGKADLTRDLDRTIGPTQRVWLMLSYQDIETVRGDAYNTITWFVRSGFRVRLDEQYNNVRLMLFEVDAPREGWDFQERRVN